MDGVGILFIATAAILWGATDALIKLYTPPKFNKEDHIQKDKANSSLAARIKRIIVKLFADFLVLLKSPGYIICQVLFLMKYQSFSIKCLALCTM